MKLNDYIKKLQKLEKEGYGELDIIYAKDDEGNAYSEVFFNPSVGYLDEDGGFLSKENAEKTHICIN